MTAKMRNNMNMSLEKNQMASLTMKLSNDRKRSQSCVDYKSMKAGKAMDSDRKPARSQERALEVDEEADEVML